VTRHKTGANDRLAVADGRVDRGSGKDPLFKKSLSEGKGLGFAADQNRNNRRLGGADLETNGFEALVHFARVAPKQFNALRFGPHDLQCLEHTTNDGGSKRCGEDETTGLVLEIFDHLARSANEASHGTKRFRESPHDDIDIVVDPKMMHRAAAFGPEDPKRMSLIHIENSSVFLCRLHHGREVGNIARHAKDTIHDDEASRLLRDTLESVAQGINGIVTVGNKPCGRDLASLND
jgi:hypothetical protein